MSERTSRNTTSAAIAARAIRNSIMGCQDFSVVVHFQGNVTSVALHRDEGCQSTMSTRTLVRGDRPAVSWHRRPISEEQVTELRHRMRDRMGDYLDDEVAEESQVAEPDAPHDADGTTSADDDDKKPSGTITVRIRHARHPHSRNSRSTSIDLVGAPRETYEMMLEAFESIEPPDLGSVERLRHINDITCSISDTPSESRTDIFAFQKYGLDSMQYHHTLLGTASDEEGRNSFGVSVLHRIPMSNGDWDDVLASVRGLNLVALSQPSDNPDGQPEAHVTITIGFDDGWELECEGVPLDDERLLPLADRISEYEKRDNVPVVEVPVIPSPSSGNTSDDILERMGKMMGRHR